MPGVINAQSESDSVWTLERCINVALKNNLTILGSELTVKDDELLLNQSRANIYPTLNADGNYGSLWGRSIDPTTNLFSNQNIQSTGFSASSNFVIYGGMRKRNTINQDKTALMASNYDLQTDKDNVMLDVTTAFLNVILDNELFENAKVQLNTTQTQLDRTEKQVKAGALPYSDELDLLAQVESNKVQVITAENNLRIAKLRLKQLLLIPSGEPFDIKIPDTSNTDMVAELLPPDQIYSTAETIMPQVKSADLNVKGAEYGVKIARGYLDPVLSFYANIYSNYSSAANRKRFVADPGGETSIQTTPIGYFINPLDNTTRIPVVTDLEVPVGEYVDHYPVFDQFRDNRSQGIGLSLSIPIFNGLQSRTAFQRSKIQSERADVQAKQVRLQLRQNIELAYNNALAANQTYEASQKQVASLEEAFRATQRSYDLGARSYIDYQVASNNLFAAKSDLLRAKYNFIFTQKVLDFYIGKPITLDK
jgi:outer membrane protein